MGRASRPPGRPAHFEALAVNRYGRTLAQAFLLNYSQKLWGRPCSELSSAVAGQRLKNLGLPALALDLLLPRRRRLRHLDGAFHYPREGIGMLFRRLEAMLDGDAGLRLGTAVRKLRHDGSRLTPNASIYFPDPDVPYTRLYESKNRSPHIRPPGRTCIALELPCRRGDHMWNLDAGRLRELLLRHLESQGLCRGREVLDFMVHRVPSAYPVLELGFESRVRMVLEYLGRFRNLHLAGRNALFRYTHIHDQFRAARNLIYGMAGEPSGTAPISSRISPPAG